jgi:hypothetical protein
MIGSATELTIPAIDSVLRNCPDATCIQTRP